MSRLLSIPREVRDEIIDQLLLSQLAAPADWQKCIWTYDVTCQHPSWEPTWPHDDPDPEGPVGAYEIHNCAKVLLFVNHQLHIETKQRANAIRVPYTADILLTSTADAVTLQPTWLTAPLHFFPLAGRYPSTPPPIPELRLRIRCINAPDASTLPIPSPIPSPSTALDNNLMIYHQGRWQRQSQVLAQAQAQASHLALQIHRGRAARLHTPPRTLSNALHFFMLHFLAVRTINAIPDYLYPDVLAGVPAHADCVQDCCSGVDGERRWSCRYVARYAVQNVLFDVVTEGRALERGYKDAGVDEYPVPPGPAADGRVDVVLDGEDQPEGRGLDTYRAMYARSFAGKLEAEMGSLLGRWKVRRGLDTEGKVWENYDRPFLERVGSLGIQCDGKVQRSWDVKGLVREGEEGEKLEMIKEEVWEKRRRVGLKD